MKAEQYRPDMPVLLDSSFNRTGIKCLTLGQIFTLRGGKKYCFVVVQPYQLRTTVEIKRLKVYPQ
ncbi:MAG: hypothetical protein DDT26_00124 [Dehalococcoidia bacterium]|nr:hypothetical protein [Chloroflexota bacterium]